VCESERDGTSPQGGKRAQTTEAALNWIFIVKCGECVWGEEWKEAGRNGEKTKLLCFGCSSGKRKRILQQ